MSYCLGRKAVVTDSRTKKLGAYIGASLPLPPIKVDWTKGVKNYGVMLNDKIGNCTICGVAHAIQVWSNNTGTEVTVPDSDILAMYEAWDGYNPNDPNSDNGGIELNVLKNWKNLGFFGHKLAAFATVSPLNTQEVKQAINLFGGIYIGMQVPNYIMSDIPSYWDIADDSTGIDGGHCVFVVGYDQHSFTLGKLYQMSIPYWNKYVDEAYALIGLDFFNTQNIDPEGFNLTQLQSDIALIQ